MNHKRTVSTIIGLATVSLLFAACGAPNPAPTPTLVLPTSTPAPTAAPTMAPTEAVAEWDYVALGDSRTGSGNYPGLYAEFIETDLGIKVNVHNKSAGGEDSDILLDRLGREDQLRELISEAEIVTIWTGGERAYYAYTGKKTPCDRALEAMERDLPAILDEIIALRGTNETIIRLVEDYQFRVKHQKEIGFFEDKQACVQGVNAIIHRVASEYGVLVAPLYLVFNGPNGDQDPESLGYFTDDVHPSPAGAAVIADALRELGYEPIAP